MKDGLTFLISRVWEREGVTSFQSSKRVNRSTSPRILKFLKDTEIPAKLPFPSYLILCILPIRSGLPAVPDAFMRPSSLKGGIYVQCCHDVGPVRDCGGSGTWADAVLRLLRRLLWWWLLRLLWWRLLRLLWWWLLRWLWWRLLRLLWWWLLRWLWLLWQLPTLLRLCLRRKLGLLQFACRSHASGWYADYASGCASMPGTPPADKLPAPSVPPGTVRAPATIQVNSPTEAVIYFDGFRTTVLGNRLFTTPVLEPGKTYFYNVRIEMNRDGQTVTTENRVTVRAGDQAQLAVDVTPTGIVSRGAVLTSVCQLKLN